MGIYYIDESGYDSNYVFAAVKVNNPRTPIIILKKWRKWRKSAKINYETNEYHDTNMTDKERKKMLQLISRIEEIRAWGVHKNNYTNRLENHVEGVIKLLNHIQIGVEDIIIIDKPSIKKKHEEKYKKEIKKELKIKHLEIRLEMSEREKGLQIADAIAGSFSRELFPRKRESYFNLVLPKLEKELIKI